MMGQSGARKLKVYSGRDGRRGRLLVAASSWAEVQRITGRSMYELRGYWSITRNAENIALAMEHPHEAVKIERDF